jgi:hypothetical protein
MDFFIWIAHERHSCAESAADGEASVNVADTRGSTGVIELSKVVFAQDLVVHITQSGLGPFCEAIDMHHLIYLSSASRPFSASELHELLARSQHNNESMGLTGLLLYKDGNFLQALEGEKEVVEKVFSKIELDRRHHGILVLFNEEIQERDFSAWTMGFHDLSAAGHDGFDEILNEINAKENLARYPAKVRAFMRTFV